MFQFTPMVRNLIIANVVVFFVGLQVPGHLRFLSLYPFTSSLFQAWQPFTHMFMHADVGHLFSNMLGLLVFGPMLEHRWGAQRFLQYWLICGLGAGLLYDGIRTYEVHKMQQDMEVFRQEPTDVHLMNFLENNAADYQQAFEPVIRQLHKTPDDARLIQGAKTSVEEIYQQSMNSPMLGASGALFGIMLAFALFFPNTIIYTGFLLPLPIKAKYLVLLYTLFEFYTGIHRVPGDNVAHFAHLGGMLVGFVLLQIWQRNRTRMY